MCLSRDNTRSWVRISHGSNKFVMDLNNNDTEIPEDELEEEALQLAAQDFAGRSKQNHKKREPAGSSSRTIPLERRNWIDIEPEKHSLRVHGFQQSDSSSSSFTESTSRRRWSGSFLENERKIFRIHSHNLSIGLIVDGKHVYQQEEQQKRRFQYCTDDSWMIIYFRAFQGHSGRNLIDPSLQDNNNSERILPSYLPYWMCDESSFYHQLWIDTWRSKFEQETDSILSVCRSYGQNSQGAWRDWLECTTSCTIIAQCMEKTSRRGILINIDLAIEKGSHSIRLDWMQSFCKEHFQLIAFQNFLDWKLEKSSMKKYTCHFHLRQRSHWSTNGQGNWVRKLFDNQKEKLLDKHNFATNPTNSKSNSWQIRATW